MEKFRPVDRTWINEILAHEPVDTLFVLGKNIGKDWTAKEIAEDYNHLSPHSRINALAGGLALRSGFAKRIVIQTGETVPDLSEARLMKSHILSIFPTIDPQRIILEEVSKNTATNAREAKKLARGNDFGRMGVLTVGFHLERAEFLFDKLGPKISEYIAAEEILGLFRPAYVQAYQSSEIVQEEIKREKMGLRIQKVPLVGIPVTSFLADLKRS